MDTQPEAERISDRAAEFEAHMRPFGYQLSREGRDYVDPEVRAAWSTWRAASRACAERCREIGYRHQQEEGAYAAGKKAGALECADALSN